MTSCNRKKYYDCLLQLPVVEQLRSKIQETKPKFRNEKSNVIDPFPRRCLVIRCKRLTSKDVENNSYVKKLLKKKSLKLNLENGEQQKIKKQKRLQMKLISLFGSSLDDIESTIATTKDKTDVKIKNKTALKFEIHQAKLEESVLNFIQARDYLAPEIQLITANIQEVLNDSESSLTHEVTSPLIVLSTATILVRNMALFYVNLTGEGRNLQNRSLKARVSIVQTSEQANAPTHVLSMPALSPVGSAIPPQIEAVLPEKSQTSSFPICTNSPSMENHLSPQQKTKSPLAYTYVKPSVASNLPSARPSHDLDSYHNPSNKRKPQPPPYCTSLPYCNNTSNILPSILSKPPSIPPPFASHSFQHAKDSIPQGIARPFPQDPKQGVFSGGTTKSFLQDPKNVGSSVGGGIIKSLLQNSITLQEVSSGRITKSSIRQGGVAKSPTRVGISSPANKLSTDYTASHDPKQLNEAFLSEGVIRSPIDLISKHIITAQPLPGGIDSSLSQGGAPPLRLIDYSNKISQDVLLLTIYPNIRDYFRWITLCATFHNANKQVLPFHVFRVDVRLFSAYVAKCGKMYGIRLLTDLSKYHVDKFDPELLISGVVLKLYEDGLQVPKERLLTNLEQIVFGCEESCRNNLSKHFYNFVMTLSKRTREKVRPSQSLFSTTDLVRLKTQITQCNLIKQWLDCQSNLSVKHCQKRSIETNKKSTPRTTWKAKRQKQVETSQLEINAQLSTACHLISLPEFSSISLTPTTQNGRAKGGGIPNIDSMSTTKAITTNCDNTNLTAATTNWEKDKSRQDEEEHVETISADLDCDLSIDDAQTEPYNSAIQTEGITRLSSDITENSNTETTTVQISESITIESSSPKTQKTTTEESEDKRTTDNCGEAIETTTKDIFQEEDTLSLALKHEVVDLKYLILNEDVIDLSWMDDDEYNEIPEDTFDGKIDLFKEDKKVEVADKEVVRPETDMEEYQVKALGLYECVCGKRALYVCACEKLMYCSFKCQSDDWNHHQSFCEDAKNKS